MSDIMPINIPRWDKLRRRQTVYEAYYGVGSYAGKPGMSMPQIADMLGVAVGTVHNDLRYMERQAGKLAVRDEAVLDKVSQNTMDILDDLDEANDLIMAEIENARQKDNRKSAFIPAMLANWSKNKELQAKVLRLLDPKIEITVRAEKAARMQEAILKALSQLAPEVYEQVLDLAERIYNEGEAAQAIDITPVMVEGGGMNGEH